MICDLDEFTPIAEIEEVLKAVLGEHVGATPRKNLTKRKNWGYVLPFAKLDAAPAKKFELAARF